MAADEQHAANVFQYKPLPRDSIRLLWLEPTVGRADTDIRLRLHRYSRNQAPAYAAISYTWGEEPESHSVLINGTQFAVRPNLWWCLYHLQSYRECSYLWIDAICINQNDVPEKNAQVRSMDQTYREAEGVIAWLGRDSCETDTGDGSEHRTGLRKMFKKPKWVLKDLAQRPYWTRMWIIQELFLAQDIVVLCGSKSFSWGKWADMVNDQAWLVPSWSGIEFEGSHAGRGRHTLAGMLFQHRRAQCKDPRDRVFAMLSLLPDYERTVLGEFFPDYSMSVERVFLITLAHLKHWAGSFSARPKGPLPEMFGIQSEELWAELQRETAAFEYADSSVLGRDYWKKGHRNIGSAAKDLLWKRPSNSREDRKGVREHAEKEAIGAEIDVLRALVRTTLR